MNIQIIPIYQINAAAYNPRVDLQPGDPEYEKLRRSIESFGYVEPIFWNERTGNNRWSSAVQDTNGPRRYGSSCFRCRFGRRQERILNLALNKVSGRWDDEALARLLDELQAGGADMELSGFDDDEVRELIGTLPTDMDVDEPVDEDDFDVEKALEQIKEPETRRGDIWQLGRHRLVCGDATDRADVALLMDGIKAALVVTDPPYNVAIESDSERLAADGRSSIMNDDMPAEEFAGFLHAVFQSYVAVLEPTAAIYVFHPSSYQREFEEAMNAAGIVVRSQCVWVKNAASFGWSQYRWQHEPVFYAHLRGKAPAWYGDRGRLQYGVRAYLVRIRNRLRFGNVPRGCWQLCSSNTEAAGIAGHPNQEQQPDW